MRTHILSALCGIAAAFVGTLLLRPADAHKSDPEGTNVEAVPSAGLEVPVPFASTRSNGTSDTAGGSSKEEVATSQKDTRTQEERWSARIQRHTTEARDDKWAGAAASALTTRVAELSQRGHVVTTDCRMTTCVATIEWKNYADANEDAKALAVGPYQTENCERHIWLRQPRDPSASYRTGMFFDCENARAGLVQERY